jgi:hypothetical protein
MHGRFVSQAKQYDNGTISKWFDLLVAKDSGYRDEVAYFSNTLCGKHCKQIYDEFRSAKQT